MALVAAPAARAEESFETPGVVRSADYLRDDLMQGHGWSVAPEATNDGVNNTYTVTSRFGSWEAVGAAQITARAGEVAALERLEEISKTEVFLDAVERSVTAPVKLIEDATNQPVETLKRVPEGVGRWFRRTTYRVQEAYHDVSETVAEERAKRKARDRDEDREDERDDDQKNAVLTRERRDELIEKAKTIAHKELRDHLRISSAERRWYRELGVDPSTDNVKLRRAIASVARVDGLTSFGMKFVTLPTIPGSSELRKTMELVWDFNPHDLLRANHLQIVNAGLSRDTARAFEESRLTLTEQTVFLEALAEMPGVAGRRHLISRAIDIETRQRARGLTSTAVLLARMHRDSTLLAEILPGSVLPVARTRARDLVAISTAEALFWTERVAQATQEYASIYADETADERRLYITGIASERFKAEVTALGWQVTDRWPGPATAAGP
ncbi:MAG: hypothetical protein AAF560_05485 [Acidobacteriota bacterium]